MTTDQTIIKFSRSLLEEKPLSDFHLLELSTSAAPVAATMTLIKLFHKDNLARPVGASAAEIFFRVINNSIYSLEEWIVAVDFFNSWLVENNHHTTFQKMLGFLQCCEESPEDKEGEYNFIDLIEGMLKDSAFIE